MSRKDLHQRWSPGRGRGSWFSLTQWHSSPRRSYRRRSRTLRLRPDVRSSHWPLLKGCSLPLSTSTPPAPVSNIKLLVQLKVLGLSLVHLLGLNLFMSPGERTNIKLVHEINPNWSNPGNFTGRVLYSIPFVGNSDFVSGPRTLQYKGMKANHQSADQWKSRIASWGTAVLARFSTSYIESTFGVARVEYAPIVGLTIHNVFTTDNISLTCFFWALSALV